MSTPEYERWQGLTVRRPDDVRSAAGGSVPLLWQAEKRSAHVIRLGNNTLPADFPYEVERADAGDALAVLALGQSIRQAIETEAGSSVHEAMQLGATWAQVAAALASSPDEARAVLRNYADGQHGLWQWDASEGREPAIGFNAEEHAAAIALCELGDHQAVPVEAAPRSAHAKAETAPRLTVKPETVRYAEELRKTPGKASSDGHAGWECDEGASLIVEANTPGPGKLGTYHGAIYACARHEDAAVERITGAEYEVDPRPAPPGHRHDPWPCGHVVTYNTAAHASLTGERQTSTDVPRA
ncbi:hypothetical protein [Streptomyces sp. NPDC101115]|uniref:hypothetical protein n=1 Tax=Streptomyces sp. NPDC101115 TaxID=3366106 RepID=UPI003801835A